jgi:hypothetical protein
MNYDQNDSPTVFFVTPLFSDTCRHTKNKNWRRCRLYFRGRMQCWWIFDFETDYMCVLHIGIATSRDRVLPLPSVNKIRGGRKDFSPSTTKSQNRNNLYLFCDKILRPAKSVKNFSPMCPPIGFHSNHSLNTPGTNKN